jgi:cell division protein FtsL
MATLAVPRVGFGRGVPRARAVTPEIYFPKAIDNSRLVKVADRRRNREMAQFTLAVIVLFLLTFGYAWQHFSSLEYGYRIQQQKAERDTLLEVNRTLHLEQAALRDPGRIDILARRMGLAAPQVGQVMLLDTSASEPSVPVLAQAQMRVVTAQ